VEVVVGDGELSPEVDGREHELLGIVEEYRVSAFDPDCRAALTSRAACS